MRGFSSAVGTVAHLTRELADHLNPAAESRRSPPGMSGLEGRRRPGWK